MKTYIAHKNQIKGFNNVSETVNMVEKIAASSVHFLKQEVFNLNVYAAEVEKILTRLSLFYQKKDNPLLQKKYTKRKTLVILTGDKGLVGGLWHGIVNAFLKNTKQYQAIIVIGAKGENYLKEENMPIIKSFTHIFDISQKKEIRYITNYIFDEFKKGVFSRVDILYPQFISLAKQTPNLTLFLPFEFTPLEITNYDDKNAIDNKRHEQRKFLTEFKLTKRKKSSEGLPIFEPSKQKVFDKLLQKYIGVFFHKIIMETKLSELSARAVAMEHAAVKTRELIKKLTLDYTKERRRIITQRQIESFTAHKII
ncbi:MAG TPA: hypothetical protein ENH26_03060 [Candidatus Wolfebacteria bacterium]|nr:hypothetical protein [Candidatus Wolfebacteria bacterium]